MKLSLLEYTSKKELERQREILSFLDHMSRTAQDRRKREGMSFQELQTFLPDIKVKDLTYLTYNKYINNFKDKFTIRPKGRPYLGYLDTLIKTDRTSDADLVAAPFRANPRISDIFLITKYI